MLVHVHYIVATLVCEILFVILHRKSSNVKQLFGLITIPGAIYFLTYRLPFLGFLGFIHIYINSLLVLLLLLFLCTVSFEPRELSKTKKLWIFICAIGSFFLVLLAYAVPWCVRAFPLENSEAILFTLFQNNVGTEGFVWNMIWDNILSPTLSVYVPVCFFFLILSLVVYKSQKTWSFLFIRYKIRLRSGKDVWKTLGQLFSLLFVVSLIVFCAVVPKLILPLVNICNVYLESNKKYNSELYLNEYVFPDSVSITFPQKKKNLIYVMMESMEVNFKDFIPEINQMSIDNISFFPGGVDVAMTGWTMAAQVAKLCAIPLNLPYGLENSDEIYSFLPNAKCLTDVLAENEYNQVYVHGSDGSFSSKRFFWNQHGVREFHDFPFYKKNKLVSEKKEIFWGVTDKTLYSLVQKELDKLTKDTAKPFALYMMTVDTHFPDGYLSDGCALSKQESSQFPSVLRCSSKMLNSFLQWVKEQNWYDNTVIVVVGDHTWSTFTDLLNIPKKEPLYWINVFVNVRKTPPKMNRDFSSLDMFPTVLDAMGVELEGRRLGLGTSLFSEENTLLEKMSKKELDSMLKINSFQYDYFMNGGSFKRE